MFKHNHMYIKIYILMYTLDQSNSFKL